METANHLSDEQAASILATVADYTMVHETGVRFAMDSVIAAIEAGIEGEIVECGVWRGGCSVAMLLAQRAVYGTVKRRVHLLDSFEGLPPVDDRDGPLAASWQTGVDPKNFFDNCRASKRDLVDLLDRLEFDQNDFSIWEGWFSDTLPPLARQIAGSGIALLRLDSDWYEFHEALSRDADSVDERRRDSCCRRLLRVGWLRTSSA